MLGVALRIYGPFAPSPPYYLLRQLQLHKQLHTMDEAKNFELAMEVVEKSVLFSGQLYEFVANVSNRLSERLDMVQAQ
jgi:hypothetical protein